MGCPRQGGPIRPEGPGPETKSKPSRNPLDLTKVIRGHFGSSVLCAPRRFSRLSRKVSPPLADCRRHGAEETGREVRGRGAIQALSPIPKGAPNVSRSGPDLAVAVRSRTGVISVAQRRPWVSEERRTAQVIRPTIIFDRKVVKANEISVKADSGWRNESNERVNELIKLFVDEGQFGQNILTRPKLVYAHGNIKARVASASVAAGLCRGWK